MNLELQQLAHAERFNLWLGPDCLAGPVYNEVTWSDVCAAELAARDCCPAIVWTHAGGAITKVLASRDVLPPLWTELKDFEDGADSRLALFDLPALKQPKQWLEQIQTAGGGHPWLVLGVSAPRVGEIAVLSALAEMGAAIYWVRLWDEPAPVTVKFPVKTIEGYDPDTCLAALLQSKGGFPPGGVNPSAGRSREPKDVLEAALYQHSLKPRGAMEAAMKAWASPDLVGVSDDEFQAKTRQLREARFKVKRLGRDQPSVAALQIRHVAEKVGGRRADDLLAWAQQEMAPQTSAENWAKANLAANAVKVLQLRAKWRRPAAAEPFYQEADRIMRALPRQEPRQWQVALDFAQTLDVWAGGKDLDEAAVLIREAVEILDRPRAGGPLKSFEASTLWTNQCSILRHHALRLDPQPAREYFDAAKRCASEVVAAGGKAGMREYLLGMIAAEEARKNRANQSELLAASDRHFQAALVGMPESEGLLHYDRGVALGMVAEAREGEESDSLFGQALEHLGQAAPKDVSSRLHGAWAGLLLKQSRKESGGVKAALLAEAEREATTAEEMEATSGAYNLACVAAERKDWSTMSYWLRISARGPKLPPPAHTDSVTSFHPVREETWFQDLLRELYPD